jgi:hypothetical protein
MAIFERDNLNMSQTMLIEIGEQIIISQNQVRFGYKQLNVT